MVNAADGSAGVSFQVGKDSKDDDEGEHNKHFPLSRGDAINEILNMRDLYFIRCNVSSL